MPNLRTYSYAEIMTVFGEVMRTIPGYDSPDKEVKALINYDSTKNNVALMINDCMILKDKKYNKKSQFIEERYSRLLGKKPRKDAAVCSMVFTLPRNYIKEHDYNISPEEYIALQKFYEANDSSSLSSMDSHELSLVSSAKDKFTHLKLTSEEIESITEYFKKAVTALCKICGIKQEDILFAVVHMDENFPHIHFSFMPMEYGKDLFNAAIEDAVNHRQDAYKLKSYDYNGSTVKLYKETNNGVVEIKFYGLTNYLPAEKEKPCGCGIKRFKKDFLYELNRNLEKEMRHLGIETKIATGKGQQFRVNEHDKSLREQQVVMNGEVEYLKQLVEQMEQQEAATQLRLMSKQNAFAQLKKDITQLIESVRTLLFNLVKDTIAMFLPKWNKETSKRDFIEKQATEYLKDNSTQIVSNQFIEIKNKADNLIKSIAEDSMELMPHQKSFITKQLQKLAHGNPSLEEAFQQNDVLEYCFSRYADTKKDREYLIDNYIPINSPEANEYMRNSNRIKRAFEEVLEAAINEPEKFDNKSVILLNKYIYKEKDRDDEYCYNR